MKAHTHALLIGHGSAARDTFTICTEYLDLTVIRTEMEGGGQWRMGGQWRIGLMSVAAYLRVLEP